MLCTHFASGNSPAITIRHQVSGDEVIAANECKEYEISLIQEGMALTLPFPMIFTLGGNGSGLFYLDNNCLSGTFAALLGAGSTSTSFYYKNAVNETVTIEVFSSPDTKETLEVRVSGHAPTLSSVATLVGATQDTEFTISYGMIEAAADATDEDSDAISFRIEEVSTGSLTKEGVPVIAGATLLSAGESFQWMPAVSATGIQNAFTIKAHDGSAVSETAVQVKVDVTSI